MLITLCYSVLTWMQSKQRTEIVRWVQECLLNKKEEGSIVFIRDRLLFASSHTSTNVSPSHSTSTLKNQQCFNNIDESFDIIRSDSFSSSMSFGESPTHSSSISHNSRTVSGTSSACNSNLSTPKKEWNSSNGGVVDPPYAYSFGGGFPGTKGLTKSQSFTGSVRQISELCFNHNSVKLRRLLWEEDRTRAIVLFPAQIVGLHDWTAFRGTFIQRINNNSDLKKEDKRFYVLLEAEPGLVQRHNYKKFTQFGEIVAWKCGNELALILESDVNELIQLMHIFRLGQIILEGGWRIFRLTTIKCEGTIGKLISGLDLTSKKKSLTPGDLRRLSAGVYEIRGGDSVEGSLTNTPKNSCSVSQDASKHDITTISEETTEEVETSKRLPNWYERSPRKRSVACIPTTVTDKSVHGAVRRRVSSFCPGSLSTKSTSLASLFLGTKSMSVDEEDSIQEEEERIPNIPIINKRIVPTSLNTNSSSSVSYESLLIRSRTPTPSGANTPSHLLSPMSTLGKPICPGQGASLSASSSPRKLNKKSPQKRIGKPPNILVLCDEEKKREEIGKVLKEMLANDRYVVYDIRWSQLTVGGWSEQTALLVLSGPIPNAALKSRILQFLGDGGRLLAWCCQDPPFGPAPSMGTNTQQIEGSNKKIVQYGANQKLTRPLVLSSNLWGVSGDKMPPPGFQKILETTDSEGYSRPMTVSTFGKVKGSNETVLVQLDGGALGGKAILSQIEFESSLDEEDSLALLSNLMSQSLGIDCTQIKSPEYTTGYLLGDHLKVKDFLGSTPSTIQQSDLTVEFIQRGEKGSLPSHLRFPIQSLACPQNFSTLDYYNNLETKELGRLVIYTDIITSTQSVITGHPLRHGLVVIANQQTSGRGRGKNVWLSPEGCAVFSLQLFIDMGESQIGRRIPLVQHIAALAVITALPNHKKINLRVKWPNDIYANDQKIGGILVESRIEGTKAIVNIGIGINVSNSYPTLCLNSLLYPEEFLAATNLETKTKLDAKTATTTTKTIVPQLPKGKKSKFLTCEKLIARTLTELEKLLESVEKEEGLEEILKLYQDNWIHGNVDNTDENVDEESLVNVEISEGAFAECRICGIDEYGFLRVIELNSGNVFSVRPDGNSFDIANRLIAIKD